MSNEDAATPATEKTADSPEAASAAAPERRRFAPRLAFGAAAVALLAISAGVGATAYSYARPAAEMAPLVPVQISAMPPDSVVTVKGTVAEVFGAKFVLQDGSGRALVETGRAGEGGKLVAANEAVTVQGRFDRGALRATWLVRADGRAEQIGGFGKKGHGPKERGPKHDRGEGKGPKHDRGDGPRGEQGRPDAPKPGERL